MPARLDSTQERREAMGKNLLAAVIGIPLGIIAAYALLKLMGG